LLESFLNDIRFSLRWLRKSPGFTLVAVASLAIGIGFNTALFTITDALLFKPLPVAAPDRLVDIFTSASGFGPFSTSSYPDYLELRAQNEVFEDIAGYSPMFAALNLDNRSRLAMGEIVTGNYFRVLGVAAARGRTIAPEDDRAGAERVAMVSYRYWLRELGSAPDAVGRTLRIRGNPYTIVGVVPPGFNGMVPILSPELWIPAAASLEVEPVGMHDAVPSPTGTTRLERRGDRWMFLRARLKPGRSLDEAQANLTLLMSRLEQANPLTNKARRLTLKATNDVHFHPAADATVLPLAAGLFMVVGLVLLIACANVASMLLARASGRQKEIAIRLAIGAGRGRLARQLLTEAVVMSMLGAVVGTLLAWWVTSMAASVRLPVAFPLTFDVRIDARVLLFTLAATLAAGLLAGLAPAVHASKPNLVADLRGEQTLSRGAGRRWTLRDALVAGQMAVTAMLLVLAALLTRSLAAAQRTNVGFPIDKLAVVSTDPAMLGYPDARSRLFYEQATERLKTIPGVESVALATRVPFSVNFNRWDIWVPGRHLPGEPGDGVEVTTVSPDYFTTIGVPILEGRSFTNDDKPETPRVAIVNETFARRYWPGESAVGKTFRSRVSDGVQFEIVGVSADHKVVAVSEPPTPFLQVARTQRPSSYTTIIARTRGDASALLSEMHRELLALEPHLVFVENQTMEAEVGATMFPVRAGALLVTIVGGVAMLLAAIGLYGVIAYSVARRTKEIGIRLALGAGRGSVVKLVMQQGLLVAVTGLAFGVLLAAIAARTIGSSLYGVRASDPVSWLAASAVLLGVSAIANVIPAWRASRVEPSQALRMD
jgi:macrolide transport system ATP-binding/permease protein